MIGKVFVIIQDLGSTLKEGMVCKVFAENEREFTIEIMNPPEYMVLDTYAVSQNLSKYFWKILPTL